MPEFPFCSHSLSFSLLESLKETGFIRTFFLSLLVFSNAKTIVNLIQERIEEADAEEAARNCTTCSPCLEHFQAFSTRISLPISMIFSPFTRSLSLSLSPSAWLSFSAFLLLLEFPRHFCELCGLIYQKSIRAQPSTTPRSTHMLT